MLHAIGLVDHSLSTDSPAVHLSRPLLPPPLHKSTVDNLGLTTHMIDLSDAESPSDNNSKRRGSLYEWQFLKHRTDCRSQTEFQATPNIDGTVDAMEAWMQLFADVAVNYIRELLVERNDDAIALLTPGAAPSGSLVEGNSSEVVDLCGSEGLSLKLPQPSSSLSSPSFFGQQSSIIRPSPSATSQTNSTLVEQCQPKSIADYTERQRKASIDGLDRWMGQWATKLQLNPTATSLLTPLSAESPAIKKRRDSFSEKQNSNSRRKSRYYDGNSEDSDAVGDDDDDDERRGRRGNQRKRSKRRSNRKFDDFIEYDDDDEIEEFEDDEPRRRRTSQSGVEAELPNLAIIQGPVGAAKTSSVYCIAQAYNFNIIEVNPSQSRQAGDIRKALSEASQSRGLTATSGPGGTLGDGTNGKAKTGKTKDKELNNNLILFDEVRLLSTSLTIYHSFAFNLCFFLLNGLKHSL